MHVCRIRGNTLERIIIASNDEAWNYSCGLRFPNFTWFDVQSGVRVVEIRIESGFKRNIPFDLSIT